MSFLTHPDPTTKRGAQTTHSGADQLKTVEFTGLDQQKKRLRETISERIAKVLDHGQFIMGPEVRELEGRLTSFCGARHAIAVANGTDALQIALMAGGIGHGDAVLVPSFTYTATAEVILILGAKPVFIEVDEHSFNIDCAMLDEAMRTAEAWGLRPRALIAVDLFGLPADWAALNAFAKAHDMFLIADAAQSFGAIDGEGRHVGTLAPVTTTSFFPAKPLGCYGDGGAIFTDDDNLADVMRSIRVHGQGRAKYETVRVGMNSRLDTLQAAVLLAKIDIFAEETERRNALADRYERRIGNLVETPKKPDGVTSAWAQYTIKVDSRESLQAKLKAEGVPTAVYYPLPMHLQKAYEPHGRGAGSLPVSERLSQRVLSLPMNPYWVEADVDHVADALARAAA
jgi:UDP-2-acetamido-2-deoxy-ribo-hexuluronate aminotransferase